MENLSVQDPTSYSRPDHHVITNLHLSLDVNFDSHVLAGKALLNVEKVDQSVEDFVLDISHLVILNISLVSGTPLDFKIGEHVEDIGSMLTISIPKTNDSCLEILIQYETSPKASALQWLDPAQTAGKKLPYLFSQCQAIQARSMVPCQDTPAVKFTYSAEVTAPEEFTVLMSALRGDVINGPGGKRSSFNQPIPIPAYLLAIAVGALEARTLGPRSSIWAEKEIIEESAWEFSETDQMLTIAEELCGPYVWGIYDLLVLPPCFAYGGMENPCLTFITPTLLAGDRSLASVVVHEITHSWTGNLVTNRNFEHFWLNEGFTVFVERKISSRLFGESVSDTKFRDFSTVLGLSELTNTVEHLGKDNPLTNLVVNLKGLNPDDAFSSVPYEKGSTFLRYLEDLLGGPTVFEPYLRHYLNTFQKKSIDTDDFMKNLMDYFKDNKAIDEVEWDKWLYTPGMPLHIPKYNMIMSEACTSLAKRWATSSGNYSAFATKKEGLTTMQMRRFLTELLNEDISLDLVEALGATYDLDSVKNSEIKFRWLRLCIKARWEEKVDTVLKFVNEQGRMKFGRLLYRDLYAWEDVRSRAIQNFEENKQYMMHISVYTIKKDLHLD